jgi:Leucine-rich repeat (LRR) protein
MLTLLDLSHNNIASLPSNIWALPCLTTLNMSHNALETLPFFAPFAPANSNPLSRTRDPRGDWYSAAITRATAPLPKLTNLDVSHNRLTSGGIDHEPGHFPAALVKLSLSGNPLGNASSIIRALSRLDHLSEIIADHTDIGDDSFPVGILSEAYISFPSLSVFDLGESCVTRPALEAALLPISSQREVEYDATSEPPKPGVLRVIVGKRVIKERWELEAERRTKVRSHHLVSHTVDHLSPATDEASNTRMERESWEIEAEQGLPTEGAKRRARAAAAAASPSSTSPRPPRSSAVTQSKPLEKEAWEIEAEQGLLTAGGRRRARAAATGAALPTSHSSSPPASTTTSPVPSGSALSHPPYYSASTYTLTLPSSTALPKASHVRSFSLAAKVVPSSSDTSGTHLGIPTPTLPLAAIALQPLSHTLKCLILTGRRMDPSFNLPPDSEGPFLPRLEELNLENCGLADSVAISKSQDNGTDVNALRTQESLLPLIARLFPSLKTLDLSYNALTSVAIRKDFVTEIILACDGGTDGRFPRSGLKHLRLRGNRLTELDGFQEVADAFKGNRMVSGWNLEELDLRDNEISRLPPEMGLLPMDVFLVDGNL